jgi:threonine synthase
VVCVLTGNGLKDPDIVLKNKFAMEKVDANHDSVLKVLGI